MFNLYLPARSPPFMPSRPVTHPICAARHITIGQYWASAMPS